MQSAKIISAQYIRGGPTDGFDSDAWSKNFKRFLNSGIDVNDSYTVEEAKSAFHATFDHSLSERDVGEAQQTFNKARNTALKLLTERYENDLALHLEAAYAIGVAKNHDYGGTNILAYGLIGLLVRLNDKFARVEALSNSEAMARDERLKDTLIDIINYSTYGIMLCNNVWG